MDDLLVLTDDVVRPIGSPAASSSISLLDVRLTRFAHPVNPLPTLGTTCRILHEHPRINLRQITIKSNRIFSSTYIDPLVSSDELISLSKKPVHLSFNYT